MFVSVLVAMMLMIMCIWQAGDDDDANDDFVCVWKACDCDAANDEQLLRTPFAPKISSFLYLFY